MTHQAPFAPTRRQVAWRNELAWATRLHLSPAQTSELEAINRFLRDRHDAPVVPVRERSLELFGYEKRLEQLFRTEWFAPDRLSPELLRCRPVAPPFAWTPLGDSPVLLVVENHTTYDTITRLLTDAPNPAVGTVAFGAGTAFIASVASATSLATKPRRILYYGDVDERGLWIPSAAGDTSAAAGLPRPEPAVPLYALLLELGRPAPGLTCPPAVAAERAAWLPAAMRPPVTRLLREGQRLAQEWTGLEALSASSDWKQL